MVDKKASRKASRKTTRKSSKKTTRKSSKKTSRKASRKTSRKSSKTSKKASRKGSTRKRKITDFTLKIGTVTYNKDKLLYINITGNLVYISWPTGRTYFKLGTDEYKKGIKDIMFYDENKMSFVYDGQWETSMFGTGKTKHAKKKYVFTFNKDNDYKMMLKLMG